jgi:translation initiation factor IF-2
LGVRVFKLAKELEMESKELVAFLRTQGHFVTSHMSAIDDNVATIIRDRLIKQRPPKEKKEKEKEKEKAARGAAATDARAVAPAERRGPLPAKSAASTPAKAPSGKPREEKVEKWAKSAGGKEGQDAEEVEGEPKEGREAGARRKRYFPTQDDLFDSGPRFAGARRKFGGRLHRKSRDAAGVAVTDRPAAVEVAVPVTVKDLSAATTLKAQAILKCLMQHGQMVTINQFLDEDQVTLVGLENGIDIQVKRKGSAIEERLEKLETVSAPANLVSRAPVVTFLGHVDHGKTSLLDRIRKTKVTASEAGGITQHLGAYRVDNDNVHVTFIDTPGHQAFTEMRARGAHVTDVAVLVVAADDGVMPQTEEALNHARAAKVPIVVALNKIDKPTANPDRCKQRLAELGLIPVEWNGDTEFVSVSAHTGQGVDTLLETLSLTSEILELKADPTRPALGVVLEAENTPGQGVLATVLVRDGTLRQGDHVLAGAAYGRVRALWRNGIEAVKEAGPSTPVKISGLNAVPEAGEKLYAVGGSQEGRQIAEERLRQRRESDRTERQQVSLETLFLDPEKSVKELRLVLKADAKGSLAAIKNAVLGLSTDAVKVKVLHHGVGAISPHDVGLAAVSEAIVLGFHVTPDERARQLAEERKVDVRVFDVIYQAIDQIKNAMAARLPPQREERIRGHAEIRQLFKASKVGTIAGCMVTDGAIGRNDQVRLLRDGRIVHTGTLSSLKRLRDDARDVKEGFECGMKIAGYDDIKPGDVIEAFTIVETPSSL